MPHQVGLCCYMLICMRTVAFSALYVQVLHKLGSLCGFLLSVCQEANHMRGDQPVTVQGDVTCTALPGYSPSSTMPPWGRVSVPAPG